MVDRLGPRESAPGADANDAAQSVGVSAKVIERAPVATQQRSTTPLSPGPGNVDVWLPRRRISVWRTGMISRSRVASQLGNGVADLTAESNATMEHTV
jgi:hypothetical protein